MTIRSTIRATLKAVVAVKLQGTREEDREKKEEEGEERGWLAKIFDFAVDNVVPIAVAATEQADTRSWITLPSQVWIGRVHVEPGQYEIFVEPEGDAAAERSPQSLGRVSVGRGETVFRSCRILDRPHPIQCDEPSGRGARRRRK